MGTPVVALVLVSHSQALAEGAAELAGQMAPDVALLAAGGTDEGLGTSFERVLDAVGTAVAGGRGAVVLTDLGSAVLTTESVLEALDADDAARVRLADAPFVEGAVEAAVAAQGGGDLDAVEGAARHAAASFSAPGGAGGGVDASDTSGQDGVDAPSTPSTAAPATAPSATAAPSTAGPSTAGPSTAAPSTATARTVLRNRLGLHARPAAVLARAAGSFQSAITVNGADARSVLSLVALGAVGGTEVVVSATGPDARSAVIAVVDQVESGFGEA